MQYVSSVTSHVGCSQRRYPELKKASAHRNSVCGGQAADTHTCTHTHSHREICRIVQVQTSQELKVQLAESKIN